MRAPARANVALIGWSVDSAATVKLITHAVGATTRDKTLGRAEALRRAMLTMIDKDEPREGHQPSGGSAQEHAPEPTLTSTTVPGLTKALPSDHRPRPSKGATTPDWRVEIWRQ